MNKRRGLLNVNIILNEKDVFNKKTLYLIKELERNKMFSKLFFKNNITHLADNFG